MKKLKSHVVEEYVDKHLDANVDLYNLEYYIRYAHDSSYYHFSTLDEILRWQDIRDLVIDYGENKCILWRKGHWGKGYSHNYSSKSIPYSPDTFNNNPVVAPTYPTYPAYECCPFDSEYEDESNYYEAWWNRRQTPTVKNVNVSKVNGNILDNVKTVCVKKQVIIFPSVKKNISPIIIPPVPLLKQESLNIVGNYNVSKINSRENKAYFKYSLMHIYQTVSPAGRMIENDFIKMDIIIDNQICSLYRYSAPMLANLKKSEVTEAAIYFTDTDSLYYHAYSWYILYKK